MNTPAAPKAHIPDIAGQITYAMRTLGVAPVPRNYQLFYEAFIGSNAKLSRELAALGNAATQEQLDAIGAQHFGHFHGNMIESAHTRIASELEGLLRTLQQEQNSLESYNRILDETCNRINSKSNASAEILRNAISILADATGKTRQHGERTAENVQQTTQEMDRVRQELDEYKRIANTDSLTRLSNRRAFDDRLATIYTTSLNPALTALVLADIDNFKRVNDTFGHPVGDKILSTVASVIRSNLRKDVFVSRSGGEEFAIIVEGNTQDEILQICERVRMALEATPFKNSRNGVNYGPITLSIGMCMASGASDSGELYAKADTALYSAKAAGRNRTMIYEDGMRKDFQKSWLIYRK